MTELDELFRDPLPDRDSYVLGQAIPFNPDQWIARLPSNEWWPKRLAALPRVGRWPAVDRRTVFQLAEHVGTLEGRRDLLIAALVWGTGTNAREVARRARIFHENGLEWLDERICGAKDEIDRGDPVAAYLVLNDRDFRVKHFGPAFFSKLLYFLTADRPVGERWPLILDSNVALALDELSPHRWEADERWDSKKYAIYLELAHSWAERWGTEPDVVERRLFDRGKRLGSGAP
ncbi:8-oxoguanine DNA glycosylase OGG fold protein [Streptomyces sp. BRA346]|uniref:8-oxoguanine DNA glycosylase OGG fold protein n=1 Tax=Streptomyces sp. BRA346 TaxID=2878199 RepID=UPI00406454E7